mgnify:CR=1 FL=1
MDINIAVLVDAKNEYTKQLQNMLTPQLYDGFSKMFNDAKKANKNEYYKLIFFLNKKDKEWKIYYLRGLRI